MSPNPFDQACRYLAKLAPELFLAWLLRLAAGDFHFRRWLDARQVRFPGEPDRTCDTVAFLEDLTQGGVPWAVPVEFQIEPDPLMFGRFLGYLGPLWLQERPSPERGDRFQLGAVVVNLTGTGNATRQMAWPKAGLLTHLGVAERNLANEDAASTLADIAAGRAPAVVLPLIPLMQGGGEAGIIQAWLQQASAETDARRRADHGGLALVFAEAAGCHAQWSKALEGWNVIQSKQVLEWQEQAHKKGRDEGRSEAQQKDLLHLLRLRFGAISAEVETRIRAHQDNDLLTRWFELAFQTTSLEQFRQEAGI